MDPPAGRGALPRSRKESLREQRSVKNILEKAKSEQEKSIVRLVNRGEDN